MDSNCSNVIPHSQCRNNMCECLTGYTASTNGTQCQQRQLGEICSTNSDCQTVNGSRCSAAGICACVDGYYAQGNLQCTPRTVGDSCSLPIDCTLIKDLAKCVDGKCQCASGKYLIG
jgi:hypothetical protein